MKKEEELTIIILIPTILLIGNLLLISKAFKEPEVLLYYPIAYLLTCLTPWLFNFDKNEEAGVKITARCLVVILFGCVLGLAS